MQLFRALSIVFFLLLPFSILAQYATSEQKKPRILLLLDGSSSMLQPWSEDANRFKAAGTVITTLMDSIYRINPEVEFSLRVYGHQSPAQDKNCFDTRNEVSFSRNNITQMGLRLASIHPMGVSPIAFSLKEAAELDLTEEYKYAYSIILFTDGGESCNGNICEVAKMLTERKINFRPYIVSMVDFPELKKEYECLGTYLQVNNEKAITPAVNTIMEFYRKALTIPNLVTKMKPGEINPPKPKLITPEMVEFKKETPELVREQIDALRVARSPKALQVEYAIRGFKKAVVPQFSIFRPDPEQSLPTAPGSGISTAKIMAPKASTIRVAPIPVNDQPTMPTAPASNIPVAKPTAPVAKPVEVAPVPVSLPKEQINAMQVFNPMRMYPAAFSLRSSKTVMVPGFTYFKPEPEAPVVTASTKPVAPPPTPKPTPVTPKPKVTATVTPVKPTQPGKLKETAYTVEKEDAAETTVSVYFTNGHGKYYQTTPQMVLADPKSGKQVQKFTRFVDASGNPDPQKVPAGTFDLMAATKSNMVMRGVVIEEKKNNKIIIPVTNGSLKFSYQGNSKRPVSEYNAVVTLRFDAPPVTVKQRCVEELEYAPGNYFIEINTLPITRANADVDFGSESVILLPEPGTVQFVDEGWRGKIILFYQFGDKFARFYAIDVNGTQQKLELKPGLYEAHYNKTPNIPYSKEEIITFSVTSNGNTVVTIH